MAKPLEYNATMTERVDITDALTLFRVTPDKMPEQKSWFVPGQYCVLGMNNQEKPELGSVRRSMSIASAPEDSGAIEFYIRWVAKPESENPLTHLLWKLKNGDRMYMRAVAAGVFTIKDTIGLEDSRIRVMVAAGTGSAPFVSMLRSELRQNPNADLSKWVLLHGASYPADLGYREELAELVAKHKLKYWGTVSRPKDTDWTGDKGRVEAFFEPGRLEDLEQRLGLPPGGFTPNNVVIYICGLTGTITGTILPLIDRAFIPDFKRIREALGVPADAKDSVFYEQYDTEPVIDIKSEDVVAPLRARMQAALAKLVTAFVLGATGFVGREVVRQLCVRGAKTIAHVRPDSPSLDEWRAKFGELGAETDATPWETLAAALEQHQPAQLYILIGTTRSKAKSDRIDGEIYERVDFGLTKLAVDAARATKPRLVYLSSVGADPTARSAYLRARGKAEAVVRESGMPWVIARPSLIVGDRDESRPGESAAAVIGDGLLAVAGVLGGKSLRAKYRSTTPDVLGSALIRIAEAPDHDLLVEGVNLR